MMQEGGEASYWKVVRRPVYALVLVCPMIIAYELGIAAIPMRVGATMVKVRNGADVLLAMLVNKLGLGGFLLTGAIILATLVVWQVMRGESWEVRGGYVAGMVAESIGLALLLAVVLGWAHAALANASAPLQTSLAGDLALSVGAGVYEEFVFRLLLIWTLSFILQLIVGAQHQQAWLLAAVISALIFAGAHYVGVLGEAFSWQSFAQRSVAGLFFAALFVLRGFGITACTHALYDVLVVVLIRAA